MPISQYELDLIERCCDGSRTAYRELYEQYAGALLVIALRYMKSQQEAEDVLQEAFIKIYKNLRTFNSQASLKTWMSRIVINTSLNQLRKSHRFIQWEQTDFTEKEFQTIPLQQYSFNELISFIQELPVGCQLVFNLYIIEGYSHKEVAELLDISVGTSKSQLHRAKELLQEIIVADENSIKTKAI